MVVKKFCSKEKQMFMTMPSCGVDMKRRILRHNHRCVLH